MGTSIKFSWNLYSNLLGILHGLGSGGVNVPVTLGWCSWSILAECSAGILGPDLGPVVAGALEGAHSLRSAALAALGAWLWWAFGLGPPLGGASSAQREFY
jgi:hypothetical protein